MTRALVLALALTACGTLGEPGGGDTALPNNRTGPFRALTSAELEGRGCVLSTFTESFEDPDVSRGDRGEIILHATRIDGSARVIVRASFDRNLRELEAPRVVLEDPLGLASPSVVRTEDRWVMVLARNGRIEVADASDGRSWRLRSVPALVPDPGFAEGASLAGPSVARAPDGRWYLAYTSDDAVWLASASAADGPWARIDADPSTPVRDPILARASRGVDGGAPELRQYSDPAITVERTSTGRSLVRVYVRESLRRTRDGGTTDETTIALAASFDGTRFVRATSPAFVARAESSPGAPAMHFQGPLRTWMFFSGSCGSARGVRVAVAPGSSALPLGD